MIGDVRAGLLRQDVGGRLSFTYDDGYASSGPGALPLCLALPVGEGEHTGVALRAYLQGLLPDNQATLDAWGRRFGVSGDNPFALLRHVGHEVAGAVRFLTPDDLTTAADGAVIPQTDADIAHTIRELQTDPSGASAPGVSEGQFSLAGAQSKFSLLRTAGGTWARGVGRYPNTHIVKPVLDDLFVDKELNEHVCLELLSRCGVPAASSQFTQFEDQTALVVRRYDRVSAGGTDPDLRVRLHQEDLCQALGVPPARKYAVTVRNIARLLDAAVPGTSREPVAWAFARGLLANWLLAGTDAHAKNYSLLHTAAQTRLAPLYDVISWLPYRERAPRLTRRPGAGDQTRVKLAMAINGKSDGLAVTAVDWRAVADQLGLDPDRVITEGVRLSDALSANISPVVADVRAAGIESPALSELDELVQRHVGLCRSALLGHGPIAARVRT